MTLTRHATAGAATGLAGRNARPTIPSITLAARAYAAGDEQAGRRLFDAAFVEIAPLVRMVVARHLDSPEDRDDAFQIAMTNVWNAVRAGRDPAIELRARGAALTRHKIEHRNVRRQRRSVEERRRDDHQADHAPAIVGSIDAERIATAAAEVRPLWGAIARLLAAGLTQAEVARALDRPAGTITRNVVEIRAWMREDAA